MGEFALEFSFFFWRTAEYPNSGQNLAMYMTTGRADASPSRLASMVESSWFQKEYENGRYYGWMDLINKFNPGDTK